MRQGEYYDEPTWNQSVGIHQSRPPKIKRRLASQRYQSSLSDCGSTIPKSSAILKALKLIAEFRRARSSRLATAFFFGDDDLVGDLPLELVRVGGGKLAASEIASYSDAADVEAGSSVNGSVFASSSFIATIRSPMDTTALLPALSLLPVLLRVKRLSSSPVADVLCASCFFGEPPVECVSACSCFAQWGCRDWGLLCSSRRTRLRFVGGVGGAAGSVDSEGVLSPRIQAAISGRELVECCRKWEKGISAMIVGRNGGELKTLFTLWEDICLDQA